MSLSPKELGQMQAAARVPGVEYSVCVAEVGKNIPIVNVSFTGLMDNDHANWFAKYIALLLELNSAESHTELPN
mgnify:CR=1 FL=1|jgi:hypothetical protein